MSKRPRQADINQDEGAQEEHERRHAEGGAGDQAGENQPSPSGLDDPDNPDPEAEVDDGPTSDYTVLDEGTGLKDQNDEVAKRGSVVQLTDKAAKNLRDRGVRLSKTGSKDF